MERVRNPLVHLGEEFYKNLSVKPTMSSSISRSPTTELAMSITLAGIYVLANFFPLTAFVGGSGFVTLEIVILPVIAWLQRPAFSCLSVLAGSLVATLLQVTMFLSFGPFAILIPLLAVAMGSAAFHYSWGRLLIWAYVFLGTVLYVFFSRGGT